MIQVSQQNDTYSGGLFHRMNMNNEQKNTYVKKQILTALLDLLKEKPLSDISVSELTSKAEIGRVSFYRNYQNKEDILKEESDRLIKEWGRLYESNPESTPESLFPSLFDFYRDHREFYTILYNAGMSSIMMETIISTIQIMPEMPNLEAYMKSFWAYGIYGWMLEWIKRGMQEGGKELKILFSLAHQGNESSGDIT
jgi:AcrR family transcriptional regulator